MSIEQHGDPSPKPDVVKLHKIAQDEEHLIDRLDTRHLGFVTIHQLLDATRDKALTPAERKTAETMLRMQDDLRYQRLGYLPSVGLSGGDTAGPASALPDGASSGGSPISGRSEIARPYPRINEPGGPTDDHSDHISMNDVKNFDAGVSRLNLARDMRELGSEYMAVDIMKKYAKHEPGKRLWPDEVWGAIDGLSKKKNLSMVEQEELEVLKATQIQMRQMWPQEPADHKSSEYKRYLAQTNDLPISSSELIRNAQAVTNQYMNNAGVDDARYKLFGRDQGRGGSTQGTTSDAPPSAHDSQERPGDASPGAPGPGWLEDRLRGSARPADGQRQNQRSDQRNEQHNEQQKIPQPGRHHWSTAAGLISGT